VLCTAPIDLVRASDARAGMATCTFTRTFNAPLPASLVVGAKIGGYYTRDNEADNVTLTVNAATDDLIAGAGSFDAATGAGRSPDIGSKAKFEINFQYQNNRNELRGNFTFNYVRTEDGVVHKYELTMTSPVSFATQRLTDKGIAVVIGSARLRDLTTPSDPVVVADGAPLVIMLTDNDDTKTPDSLSVILYKSAGGVWLAAGWDGVNAVEQPLTQGNLNLLFKK